MPKTPVSPEKQIKPSTASDSLKSTRKPYADVAVSSTMQPSILTTGVIDVSGAANSAQAIQMAEGALLHLPSNSTKTLDLNAGHLLLTKGVLARIGLQLKKYGITLNTVYSKVPQTQQAALDEGFFVKETPAKPALSSLEQLHQHLEQGAISKASQSAAAAKDIIDDLLPPLLNDKPDNKISFEVNDITSFDPIFDQPAPAVLPSTDDLVYANHTPNQFGTLLVKGTLRSGQVLRYAGNLVILGDAHAGSEITADGDIVIWGELLGIAHAGANGNTQAEIRAMKIEALQLRIADHIARRPDRIYYHKSQGSSALPSPEVVRIHEGEIRVFKESLGI